MKDEQDLPRLLDSDDVPADLRSGLERLRAHVATPAQMSALSDRLGVDRPPAGSPPSPAPAKSAALVKGVLGVGAVAGGVALVLLLRPAEPKQVNGSEKPIAAASASADIQEPAPGATGRSPATAPNAAGAAPSAPASSGFASPPPPNVEGANARGPAEAPAASPARDERRSSGESAPTASAERSPSKSMSPGGSSKPATPERSPGVVSEIDLLRDARATLPVDPGEALAITERHRAAYPRGSLAQEREVLAITALVKLGRSDAARKRAEQFRSAYPKSAYLMQLERILPKP